MTADDSMRYSKRQGRKFGLTLGPAFAALAAFLWWRSHMRAAWVMAALAGLLSFLALAAPTSLRRVESVYHLETILGRMEPVKDSVTMNQSMVVINYG